MGTAWVTAANPTPGPVVNSLNAACEAGYVPDRVHLLSNPSVADAVDSIESLTETIVGAYGQPDVTVHVEEVADETEFNGIVEYYRDAIARADAENDTVAVDVTPGRKFMSAIAFQAGIQFGADHVYYLLVDSSRYYELLYPEIPRSGLELIDFTEELA
jgi:hypothetical protein